MKIKGELEKLKGNSYYGKTITNVDKFTDTQFMDREAALKAINKGRYKSANLIAKDCYEINLLKKVVQHKLPKLVGFYVYQYAKLWMLEFYYKFLAKYHKLSQFQMIEMDTDSMYFACAEEKLEHISDYQPGLCQSTYDEVAAYYIESEATIRKPGLFKLEWEGDGMIALCSKTYYCWKYDAEDPGEEWQPRESTNPKDNKATCKGISKDLNKKHLCMVNYLRVLALQKSGSGVNKGLRIINNDMVQYKQKRDGLSYFYSKRCVLKDRESTKPLKDI